MDFLQKLLHNKNAKRHNFTCFRMDIYTNNKHDILKGLSEKSILAIPFLLKSYN